MRGHEELSAGTLGGKLGCIAAAFVGLPLWGVLWFLSFYGHCHEGDPCRRGEGLRVVIIIIGIVAAVSTVVALTVRSFMNRRRANRKR